MTIFQRYVEKIDEKTGDAGHVLLHYKSGGTILTSMGHWIELIDIDPSEKNFSKLLSDITACPMHKTWKPTTVNLASRKNRRI